MDRTKERIENRKQVLTCGLPLEHGGHCERIEGHEGRCDRWVTVARLGYHQPQG